MDGDTQTQISRAVRTAQLTNSWYVTDENGEGFGYSADSFHPLQKHDGYGDVTLTLNGKGTVTLAFSDNYPPQSVSVQRWNAIYAGADSFAEFDNGEPVNVSGYTFEAYDDGNGYIYEVHAKWNEGDSFYVFSTKSFSNGLTDFASPDSDLPGLTVRPVPNSYTLAMSSTPGIWLDISYTGEYADVRYRAENGTFITWINNVITDLGNDVTEKSETQVYWSISPDLTEAAKSDTVTVTVLNAAQEQLAETTLLMLYEDGLWTAVNASPAP
ncbi:MAG: hypothetical protein LBS21_16475 [Clostridiales bacterium]|nr:hypothetical protein [Clostridiales bacterium]